MIGGWAYPVALAATLALALVLTPLALRVAQRKAMLDRPGGYKRQPQAVPYLGGVALVIAFATVVLVAAVLGPPGGGYRELAAVLAVGVGLCLVGLIDDLRGGLPPLLRLALQIAAGVAMWAAGVRVGLFGIEAVNAAVTVFWIVGITNAFNLLDNMDGLSAGIATIASGFFFLIAALNGQVLVASLAIALGGCAVGFLHLNFHPARIYMGDAGSLFLGFMLAILGLKVGFEAPTGASFLVPVLVLGVAIFDTSLVTACRLLAGRNPMKGGRDHVSHRLVFLGLSVPVAVGTMYGVSGALGMMALVTSRMEAAGGLAVAGVLVAAAAAAGLRLGAVAVYEGASLGLPMASASRHGAEHGTGSDPFPNHG